MRSEFGAVAKTVALHSPPLMISQPMEAFDAATGAAELVHETTLANPLHDLRATLVDLDYTSVLTGWNSAGIAGRGKLRAR
jgi:hypothetical protein